MRAYLLNWNPAKWHWKEADIEKQCERLRRGKKAEDSWSFGRSLKAQKGDRVFMIKLGNSHPLGIIGLGTVTGDPSWGPHYSGDKKRELVYAPFRWDCLVNGYKSVLVPREELDEPPFSQQHWAAQNSGISIAPKVADALEKLVVSRYQAPAEAALPSSSLGIETLDPDEYLEGGKARIVVNRYERDQQARAACLARFGSRCCACDVSLEEVYGQVAASFIHIHHLLPVSKLKKKQRVDPTKDLRPVCPNCHAIIHRREPPYSIEELKGFIADNTRRGT